MKIKPSIEKMLYYLFICAFFVMPMGTSPFTIIGGCTLLLWIFSGEFIRKRDGYLKKPWFIPVLLIILISWIGLIWSPDASGLGIKYAKKSHYWLYAMAVASIGLSNYQAEKLIKAFLIGLMVNSLVGFLQLVNMVPRFATYGKTGYTGFYGGYNTLAILLILGMLISSFYFKSSIHRKEKIFYSFLLVAYFFHLIILEGRGGYLTFFILSPIIVFNLLYNQRLYLKIATYILALVITISSPVVQFRIHQGVESLQKHLSSDTDVLWGKKNAEYIDRIYMWRWAIDLFIQNPILGVGTGGYKKSIIEGGGGRGIAHPHNNLLFVAVSYGITGLLIFGWLFWILLKTGFKKRNKPPGFFILSSSLVILIGGLTDTHILDAGGAFLLALTTGLLSVLPVKKEL